MHTAADLAVVFRVRHQPCGRRPAWVSRRIWLFHGRPCSARQTHPEARPVSPSVYADSRGADRKRAGNVENCGQQRLQLHPASARRYLALALRSFLAAAQPRPLTPRARGQAGFPSTFLTRSSSSRRSSFSFWTRKSRTWRCAPWLTPCNCTRLATRSTMRTPLFASTLVREPVLSAADLNLAASCRTVGHDRAVLDSANREDHHYGQRDG